MEDTKRWNKEKQRDNWGVQEERAEKNDMEKGKGEEGRQGKGRVCGEKKCESNERMLLTRAASETTLSQGRVSPE